MEILIIGTEPPCVRCLNTYKRAKEVAEQFPGRVEVKKVAVHSPEANKYGKVESGHGIAEAGNIKRNPEKTAKLSAEIAELSKDPVTNSIAIEAKFKELDEALMPLKEKARELGILMTPVVVVNGKVKSMDYVPAKEAIRAWIEDERKV